MNANAPRRGPLLLVAEDHRVNRVLIERVLSVLGYRTQLVENGQEAVDAVRGGSFAAALLDIEMPVMNGLEAAQAIRALGGEAAKLPLLALTAHTADEIEADARRAGFDGFASKPVTPANLSASLRALLGKT